MNPGELSQRITIQSQSAAQDSNGEMVPTWAVFATVWASIYDISGKEYLAGAAVQNPVQTKIIIRYLAGVLPAMRVIHGANTFRIEAVLGQDKKTLTLMCSRLA